MGGVRRLDVVAHDALQVVEKVRLILHNAELWLNWATPCRRNMPTCGCQSMCA